MKRKFFRRLTTAIAATAMIVTMMAGTVMAAGEKVTPITDTSTINVHVIDGSEGAIGTGESATVTGKPVAGAELIYANIGQLVQVTDGTSTRLMFHVKADWVTTLGLTGKVTQVDAYNLVEADDLQAAVAAADLDDLEAALAAGTPVTTNDAGVATVTGANGLYLFIGGDMPAGVVTKITPFVVSAPMPKVDGSGWNTTIHAYPKVRSIDDFDFEKTATAGGGAALNFVEAGTVITYKLTANVPQIPTGAGDAAALTAFAITDTMPAGVTLDASSVVVKVGANPLTAVTDYTFTANPMKIDFTAMGLAKLAGGTTVEITYTATVDGTVLGALTNDAQLTYAYDGNPGTPGDGEDTVYTYGIDLTKTLSDGAAVAATDGITFQLHKNTAGGEIVKVKGNVGAYIVDTTGVEDLVVGANGKLLVDGLAPGTYVLVETASKEGYSKLDEPITIVITATENADGRTATMSATVDGQAATINNNRVVLSVENTRITTGFTLPKTGGTGTVVAVAIGFACICGALVLLSVYRRKQK